MPALHDTTPHVLAEQAAQFEAARLQAVEVFLSDHLQTREVLHGEDLPDIDGQWMWESRCSAPDCGWTHLDADITDAEEAESEHAADHVAAELPHLLDLVTATLKAEWHTDQCGCDTFPKSCATWPDRIPEPTWGPETTLSAAAVWLHAAAVDTNASARRSQQADQDRHREHVLRLEGQLAQARKRLRDRQEYGVAVRWLNGVEEVVLYDTETAAREAVSTADPKLSPRFVSRRVQISEWAPDPLAPVDEVPAPGAVQPHGRLG